MQQPICEKYPKGDLKISKQTYLAFVQFVPFKAIEAVSYKTLL